MRTKETIQFLFVADVSGSMYGKKIASVNAAITECLAELRQMDHSDDYDIKVSIITFSEKMQLHKLCEKIGNVGTPHLKVEPQEDGFYRVTSFSHLYSSLSYLFERQVINDSSQGKNTFIFLFSDAKPVDAEESEKILEQIQTNTYYKNAAKYVAYVDEESDKYNKNTIRFVDYQAERIVRVADMPNEIGKLQMTLFSDFSSQSDNAKYDQIFI